MKTALIIGAGGTIGGALANYLHAKGVDVIGTTHESLDLATPASWPELPQADVAYLCAAITKLNDCENDPESTRLVNVTHMQLLAERLLAQGHFVVFLSSNQVFNGKKPHVAASDAPSPPNQYGKQKAEMEQWLMAREETAVLRLTKVISTPLPMIAAWKEALAKGEPVEAFDDLLFAPIPLNAVIEALTQIGEKRLAGISQLSGADDISYYEIAQKLADRLGVDRKKVVPAFALEKGIPASFLPKHGTLASTFADILIPPAEEILF